jgi:nitrogenase molybdenum-iron protein alpha chain
MSDEQHNVARNTIPTRENRLNTITAYVGSGNEIEGKARGGCLLQQDRRFSQSAACAEMMPLCNSSLIDGNVVIAHSPVGCSGMLNLINLVGKAGRLMRGMPAQNAKGISTNLSEHDVVYGGGEELEKAILEAEERYSPPAITIITSCASGIIGDDVDSIVKGMQHRVKATLIPMQCEGFRSGVVSTGYDAFLSALLQVIDPPKKKRKDTLLLINPLSISRPNEVEIERLLAVLGLKAQWFPLFTDFENVRNAAETAGVASLCSLMSNYFFKQFKDKFDVPFVEPPMPVGLEFTDWWLRDVGKMLGIEDKVEQLIESEHARVKPQIEELKAQLQGKRAYIGFNLEKSLSLQSLLIELGIETVVSTGFEYSDAYGLDRLENLNKRCSGNYTLHIGNFQHFEWAHLFNREKPDMLVGGLELGGAALRQGVPVAPVLPGTFYLGYDGAVNYGKEIVKSLRNTAYSRNLAERVKLPYRKNWFKQKTHKYIGRREK